MVTTRPNKRFQDLCKALLTLKNPKEAEEFLEDLLTPAEIDAVTERWTVARLLNEGISYRSINEATGVSTATVTRVARCVVRGSGGYRRVLERIRA